MTKETVLEALEQLKIRGTQIKKPVDLTNWKSHSLRLIERVYGKNSTAFTDIQNVSISFFAQGELEKKAAHLETSLICGNLILSLIEDIERFGLPEQTEVINKTTSIKDKAYQIVDSFLNLLLEKQSVGFHKYCSHSQEYEHHNSCSIAKDILLNKNLISARKGYIERSSIVDISQKGIEVIESGGYKKYLEKLEQENNMSITINNNNENTNHNTQNQTTTISFEAILDLIKDEVTGKQYKEIETIIKDDATPEIKQKNIFDKLLSFGENVGASIVASIITNPTLLGL